MEDHEKHVPSAESEAQVRRLVDEALDGVCVEWPDPGSAATESVPVTAGTPRQQAALRKARREAEAAATAARRADRQRRETEEQAARAARRAEREREQVTWAVGREQRRAQEAERLRLRQERRERPDASDMGPAA